jgi:hypothetical protein
MANDSQKQDPEGITQLSLGSAAHAAQPQEWLRTRKHPVGKPQRVAGDAALVKGVAVAFSGLSHPFRMPLILEVYPGLRRVSGLPWATLCDPFRIMS